MPSTSRRPKKRARAKRLPPHERRKFLLASAVRTFADQGLSGGRHAGIAKDAGVSLSTVFTYFPTRKDLVDAVLDEVARLFSDLAREVHDGEGTAPEKIRLHAAAFANLVDTHPEHTRVWLNWSVAIRDDMWPRYLTFQSEIVDRISSTLRRGQSEGSVDPELDTDDEARVAWATGHMIAQLKFEGRSPEVLDRFIATMVHGATGITSS